MDSEADGLPNSCARLGNSWGTKTPGRRVQKIGLWAEENFVGTVELNAEASMFSSVELGAETNTADNLD